MEIPRVLRDGDMFKHPYTSLITLMFTIQAILRRNLKTYVYDFLYSFLVHVDRDVSTPFNFPASQITNKKKRKEKKRKN